MRNSRFWMLFAACSCAWLILLLLIAPAMSGVDVFIFRDAGWNLAQFGSFESAGLVYMRDLTARLYAHYTPIYQLLFAAYLTVFPKNAYAGTVFNFLLGVLAAAVALRLVLLQSPRPLRNFVAAAVCLAPVLFITYDRPESLGLVLFCAALYVAAKPGANRMLTGLMLSLCFLAHPFVALVGAIWASALTLLRNWNAPARWLLTIRDIAIVGAWAVAPLLPVALLYYSLDHDSLTRFAQHALGMHSGLGVTVASGSKGSFLKSVRYGMFGYGHMESWHHVLSMCSALFLLFWSILHRKSLSLKDWLLVASALLCIVAAQFLFPIESRYVTLMAFLIPLGLLVNSKPGDRLVQPSLGLILFALFINLPLFGFGLLQQVELRATYQAAIKQPAFLLANLPSPDAVVALEGDSYDIFKPYFRHIVQLDYSQDDGRYANLGAVVNCYDNFLGEASIVRPLPKKLDAADFRLIQANPRHMWVTLFGHRINHFQMGYGCDLYVRNRPAAASGNLNP